MVSRAAAVQPAKDGDKDRRHSPGRSEPLPVLRQSRSQPKRTESMVCAVQLSRLEPSFKQIRFGIRGLCVLFGVLGGDFVDTFRPMGTDSEKAAVDRSGGFGTKAVTGHIAHPCGIGVFHHCGLG